MMLEAEGTELSKVQKFPKDFSQKQVVFLVAGMSHSACLLNTQMCMR